MSEVTVKRICESGWKNCQRPELMKVISRLELAHDKAIADGIEIVKGRDERIAELEAVKEIVQDMRPMSLQIRQDLLKALEQDDD